MAAQTDPAADGEVDEPAGVRAAELFDVVSSGVELRQRELPGGLQQAISLRGPLDQGMIDEGGEDVDRFGTLESLAATHSLKRVKCEATHEHGQPPQHSLLDRIEQLVGPSQRGLEGALSVDTPAGISEKRQSVAQAFGDVGGPKGPATTRRQFDR